jgi:hypothetical protein
VQHLEITQVTDLGGKSADHVVVGLKREEEERGVRKREYG